MKTTLLFEAILIRIKNRKFFIFINFLLFLGFFLVPANFSGNTKVEQDVTLSDDSTIHITQGVIIYDREEIITKESVFQEEKPASKPIAQKISPAKTSVIEANKVQSKIVAKSVKSNFDFTSASSRQRFGVYQKLNNSNSITHPNSFGKAIFSGHFSEILISVFFFRVNCYKSEFSKTANLSHFLFSRPPPVV